MKAITVEQLFAECVKQIKAGNGKRRILISTDDEGNGYHELFFGFSGTDFSDMEDYELPFGLTTEEATRDYITLA